MSNEETRNKMPDPNESSESSEEIVTGPQDTAPIDDVASRFDVTGAALGALDAREEAEIRAAAAADPAVLAELAAMENVAAELARLAPARPINRGRSAGIRSRLVARAAATHLGRPASRTAATPGETDRPVAAPLQRASASRRTPLSNPHTTPSTASPPARPSAPKRSLTHYVPFEPPSRAGFQRIAGMLAVAAVVVLAAIGVYTWTSRASVTRGAEVASRDSALELQVALLRSSLAQKDSVIASLTGMRTRVIDLVGYKSVDPMARMFWDQKSQMFIMYASHLKQPPDGKTYQVWLIARGVASPISAGTFMPDSSGAAVLTTRHPMEPGTLRRIAVTEEPMGGMSSPTGPIVFTGVGK